MSATVSSTSEVIGASGQETADGYSFSRVFIVVLSAADSAGADIALTSSSLPKVGSAWPYVIAGRRTPLCTERTVRVHDNSRKHWLVECRYGNSRDALNRASNGGGTLPSGPVQQSGDPEISPWAKAHLYTFSPSPIEAALQVDAITNLGIVNTAGDTYDPPPQRTLANIAIKISRASTSYDPHLASSLLYSTNASSKTINGKYYRTDSLLLTDWTATKAFFIPMAGVIQAYYEETIELLLAAAYGEEHKIALASVGYNQILNGARVPILTDADGAGQTARITTPNPLDVSGAPSFTPEILYFSPYPSLSWSGLGQL